MKLGRLWWQRDAQAWALQYHDGEVELCKRVVLRGGVVETMISPNGGAFDLPGNPIAIVEFCADVVSSPA